MSNKYVVNGKTFELINPGFVIVERNIEDTFEVNNETSHVFGSVISCVAEKIWFGTDYIESDYYTGKTIQYAKYAERKLGTNNGVGVFKVPIDQIVGVEVKE